MSDLNQTKLIEILDPQAGAVKETVLGDAPRKDAQDIMEIMSEKAGKKLGRRMRLSEIEEAVGTSQFPTLLRDGIRPILFDAYAMVAQSWQSWASLGASDKPIETYLEGSTIGLLQPVGEGDNYPNVDLALDRSVTITNQKFGGILQVTREMILFDRVNLINQMTGDLGRALAMTKEQLCYNVLTTAGNYTRNSTTGDNDIGANTAATTFGGLGIELALSTLISMKHNKSGRYLGVMPNTLICGPRLQWAAKQLLLADTVQRAGGNSTNDVYGTGTTSAYRGVISSIIVSPFVASYNWVLCEAKKFIQVNQVWGPELFQTSASPDSEDFIKRDSYLYRADEMYGVGMLNDRFAFYSSATAAPIAN